VVGASDQQFIVSTTLTLDSAYPAVASNGMTTIIAWDFADTVGSGTGVACRAIDASGNAGSGQNNVSADAADVVTATPLSNDNFALSWQIYVPSSKIRSIIVKPDCTSLAPAFDVSQVVSTMGDGPHHSDVAGNGTSTMYEWILDGNVHIRAGGMTGVTGNDTTLLTHSAQYEARMVRVVPMGTGYGVVVRWAYPLAATGMGPGKIEMFTITPTGMITGSPQLITDQSLSDFASGSQSFGVATRSDGEVLIAWHQCDMAGTPGTCDVLGRFVKSDGTPIGTQPFMIPTTTLGDQTGPSVVALTKSPADSFVVTWTDESHFAPDTQGKAVRARVVYDSTGSN